MGNHYSCKQSLAFLLSFSKIACTKSIFHPSFHPMTMTKRPFKCCAAYVYFCSISIFFTYTFLFLKKELIRSASCITVFATVVSSLWKWESLSAFFGSKIFHHHRHFDTVHCSNLVIKMLEIRCVYPEIIIILNANSSYDLADMRKAT